MAKKEVKTDLWVARQLDDSQIKYDAQGSNVKEINDALQSASKRGTGNVGYPEYVAVVKDFVIVIEDKADLADALKKWDAMISALPATALGVGIFFAFLRWLEIGFLTFLVVIGSVAVPILSVWAMSMELAEELGEPLSSYLSPDQKKKCLSMVLGAIAIILVGSWLGFRFLVNL